MARRKAKGLASNKQIDLEELFYSLIYLFKGSFPWDNEENENHKNNCNNKNQIKESTSIIDLCSGLPE